MIDWSINHLVYKISENSEKIIITISVKPEESSLNVLFCLNISP